MISIKPLGKVEQPLIEDVGGIAAEIFRGCLCGPGHLPIIPAGGQQVLVSLPRQFRLALSFKPREFF
jgi:hypothetical protein